MPRRRCARSTNSAMSMRSRSRPAASSNTCSASEATRSRATWRMPRARLRHRRDLERLCHSPSRRSGGADESGHHGRPESGAGSRDSIGAGGASTVEALEAEGTRDVGQAIELAKRHLDAGAHMIMIESEGITEQVREWRTDVVARIVSELALEQVMSEAADPDVFSWYVKTTGSTSTSSSTTARSSSSSAFGPGSGALTTPGAGFSPTAMSTTRADQPSSLGTSTHDTNITGKGRCNCCRHPLCALTCSSPRTERASPGFKSRPACPPRRWSCTRRS